MPTGTLDVDRAEKRPDASRMLLYSLELLAVPDLDTVYVPIGLGSGICGMLAARDALGLKTEVVGVVSDALEIIRGGVDRIIQVTDDEVREAMRLLFECTHNTSEGAGAAATAAALQERSRNAGGRVAVIMSGGNVDREVFGRGFGGAPAKLTQKPRLI